MTTLELLGAAADLGLAIFIVSYLRLMKGDRR
jgi:hypothetical protein